MGATGSAFKEGQQMGQAFTVHELGNLDGDVVVFGGPYSNLQATQALLADTERRGVPASNCICTGDVVAYCADAAATVAAIRDFGCPLVAGNCEKRLAVGAADCGCGFDEGTECDMLSAAWYAYANAALGAADRDWMKQLPDIVTFGHNGRRVAVIHGGLSDIARFMWPTSDQNEFAAEIALIKDAAGPVDQVVAGHCGIAFKRDVEGVGWINAGAIGMPPHDGRPQTRFTILSAEGGVVFHRLSYDQHAAIAAMQVAGLTQGYDRALKTGFWPSEDVLPAALRIQESRANG